MAWSESQLNLIRDTIKELWNRELKGYAWKEWTAALGRYPAPKVLNCLRDIYRSQEDERRPSLSRVLSAMADYGRSDAASGLFASKEQAMIWSLAENATEIQDADGSIWRICETGVLCEAENRFEFYSRMGAERVAEVIRLGREARGGKIETPVFLSPQQFSLVEEFWRSREVDPNPARRVLMRRWRDRMAEGYIPQAVCGEEVEA